MNSWTLGQINGIWIRVHWTFIILPIWIYFSSIMSGTGVTAALATVLFVLAIFGCVLLHELGHALAARQFGIPTRDITLLPIGGVAALERMPRNPWQELWIAVAGPLVNVVIATVLFVGLWIGPAGNAGFVGRFIQQLAITNIALVVFNMIPAFPMDGGRVLRSVLAMFMEWVRATSIAVSVGKFAAFGLGFLGLFSGNLMIVLIALFVYFAAHSELMAATGYGPQPQFAPRPRNSGLWDQPEADGVWFGDQADVFEPGDDGYSVPASLTANSVAAWLANRKADYCRVVESGRTIGTITKSQLLVALSRGFGNEPVGSLVR